MGLQNYMHNHAYHSTNTFAIDGVVTQLILSIPFIFAFALYILAVVISNKRHKKWPKHRVALFTLGVFFAVVSVAGPLATQAHKDFIAHMIGHLFLGMLAPLLIALSAPMTLLLRALQVRHARKISKLFKSWPTRIMTNPVFTSIINIGGLWILYTTNLFSMMHENLFLYLFIHFHIFIAGYLFTISMIYIDPIAHRVSYLSRAITLLLALAGHAILSKYIYANPPNGVLREEAELGGMLMYYGGDMIDTVIIFILCLHWYKAYRPRGNVAIGHHHES